MSTAGQSTKAPSVLPIYLMTGILQGTGSSRIYLLAIYGQQLHASRWSIGLLFVFWVLGAAGTAIPAGVIADRFGRRQVLLAGSLAGFATLLASALAGSLTPILAFQFLAGVAGGSVQASLMAALGDASPTRKLGRALGWFTLSNQLAMLGGPAAGGLLLSLLPLRMVVIVFACAYLAAPLLIGLAPIGTTSTSTASLLVQVRRLSLQPGLYPLMIALLAIFMLFGTYSAYLPIFGTEGLRLPADQVGYLLALQAAVNAPSRIPIGRLIDRTGRPGPLIVISILLTGGSLALLPHLSGFWAPALLMMAFAPALGLMMIASSVAFYSVVGNLPRGSAMGALVSIQMIGFAIGPTLAAPLMQVSYAVGFGASVAISMLTITAVVIWRGLDFDGARKRAPAVTQLGAVPSAASGDATLPPPPARGGTGGARPRLREEETAVRRAEP